MIEYLLDMYYDSGAGHRIKLSKESFNELYGYMQTGNSDEETVYDFTWLLKDKNGSLITTNFDKCSFVKLWARYVDNPLNTEELYEDPLS